MIDNCITKFCKSVQKIQTFDSAAAAQKSCCSEHQFANFCPTDLSSTSHSPANNAKFYTHNLRNLPTNSIMPWLHVKWNYFSHHWRLSKIILFLCVETCLKWFLNYFWRLLQLINIFQHVHCHWNNLEIISELFQWLKQFYFSFRRGYMRNKTMK